MSPIVWELGLTVVALVGFAVWQTVTLKRDMRITRERREREAREATEREDAGR
jgi:heme exporter protein D